MTRVNVRRADPADAAAIADVWIASRDAAFPAIPRAVHTETETRTYVADVLLQTDAVWVALIDETVVGMLALGDGWIDQLYVAPDHAGSGIGARLLDVAMEQYDALQLWTFAANTGARRFYERHGFVAVEETDGSANEERTPDVRYAWRRAPQ